MECVVRFAKSLLFNQINIYKAKVREYSLGEFCCHDDKDDQLLTW